MNRIITAIFILIILLYVSSIAFDFTETWKIRPWKEGDDLGGLGTPEDYFKNVDFNDLRTNKQPHWFRIIIIPIGLAYLATIISLLCYIGMLIEMYINKRLGKRNDAP